VVPYSTGGVTASAVAEPVRASAITVASLVIEVPPAAAERNADEYVP
jgi:hypothetical protein